MMNSVDQAVVLFRDGRVCSQAILAVYGQPLGLSRDHAMRIAAGFAGGMRLGETGPSYVATCPVAISAHLKA